MAIHNHCDWQHYRVEKVYNLEKVISISTPGNSDSFSVRFCVSTKPSMAYIGHSKKSCQLVSDQNEASRKIAKKTYIYLCIFIGKGDTRYREESQEATDSSGQIGLKPRTNIMDTVLEMMDAECLA